LQYNLASWHARNLALARLLGSILWQLVRFYRYTISSFKRQNGSAIIFLHLSIGPWPQNQRSLAHITSATSGINHCFPDFCLTRKINFGHLNEQLSASIDEKLLYILTTVFNVGFEMTFWLRTCKKLVKKIQRNTDTSLYFILPDTLCSLKTQPIKIFDKMFITNL
jgi:hypothetical protein